MLEEDPRPGFLDITRNEAVVFDPALRIVGHPFSDADELGEVRLRCYALDEIMAEKVRAVLGQRVYAISRDIYDIFSLMEEVDERKVLAGLPRKMAARDVNADAIELSQLTDRKDEFRADWARNLAGLLPPGAEREFDEVWESVVDNVGRIVERLDRNRKGAQ